MAFSISEWALTIAGTKQHVLRADWIEMIEAHVKCYKDVPANKEKRDGAIKALKASGLEYLLDL